jgi:diacylglycerol kinase (ATP)
MKNIHLLHNPTAGAATFTRKNLVGLVKAAGYNCTYSSTKKNGTLTPAEDSDIIAIAGGDGTVRKVAAKLLNRKVLDRNYPIGLLPLGTANNIAGALGIVDVPEDLPHAWHKYFVKKFDVGRAYGVPKHKFFLEGLGYGVFPTLINEMKNEKANDDPQKSKTTALKKLLDIAQHYQAHYCEVVADDVEIKGKVLLAEIMNVVSVGPNLNLAPAADPGDGYFEVVLLSEHDREKFIAYVTDKIEGRQQVIDFPVIRARNVTITWSGTNLHIDDETVSVRKNKKIDIELRDGLLNFLAPDR